MWRITFLSISAIFLFQLSAQAKVTIKRTGRVNVLTQNGKIISDTYRKVRLKPWSPRGVFVGSNGCRSKAVLKSDGNQGKTFLKLRYLKKAKTVIAQDWIDCQKDSGRWGSRWTVINTDIGNSQLRYPVYFSKVRQTRSGKLIGKNRVPGLHQMLIRGEMLLSKTGAPLHDQIYSKITEKRDGSLIARRRDGVKVKLSAQGVEGDPLFLK